MKISKFFGLIAVLGIVLGSFSSVEAVIPEPIIDKSPLEDFMNKKVKETKEKISEAKVEPESKKVSADKTSFTSLSVELPVKSETKPASNTNLVVASTKTTSQKRSLSSLISQKENHLLIDVTTQRFICYEFSERMKHIREEIFNRKDQMALEKAQNVFYSEDQDAVDSIATLQSELGRLKKEYRHLHCTN